MKTAPTTAATIRLHTALLLLLIPVAISLSACSSNEATSSTNNALSTGITGGQLLAATDPLASSTVLVVNYDSRSQDAYFCTGTIISPDLVVTAAHCVSDLKTAKIIADPVILMVFFKTSVALDDIEDALSNTKALIHGSGVRVHPDYVSVNGMLAVNVKANDIALVHLNQALPHGYKPAKVLHDASVIEIGLPVVLAGFGPPDKAGTNNFPYQLRTLSSTVADPMQRPMEQIEVLNKLDGTIAGTSEGDSGGPAYIHLNNQTYLAASCSNGPAYDGFETAGYESMPANLSWLQTAAASLKGNASF